MKARFTKARILTFLLVFILILIGVVTAAMQITRVTEAADCPAVLQSPITGPVKLDASNFISDNTINCSSVDIHIQSGGILRILPYVIDNDLHTDDYGLVIQANSVTIDEGGTIDLAGAGYGPGAQALHVGSGKSSYTVETCLDGYCGGSGGGHGGAGGRGDTDAENEAGNPGLSYGERESPVTLGSGGGTSGQNVIGGAGGGALKLEIAGTFTLNGTVNANGNPGQSEADTGGGGGAGGSIWIEAGSFAGAGSVSAEGGNGGIPGVSGGTGGGGGGGRVVMRCTTANSFSGSVTISEGIGNSNNGQVGTVVGPSCYPTTPSGLSQYEYIDSSTQNLIPDNGHTQRTSMQFRFTVSDVESTSTLTPQLEIREVGQAFTGNPTHPGTPVSYTGTPVEAVITVTGLLKTKEYKWQVRTRDSNGVYSNWVEYEEDASEEIDFIILGDASSLIKVSGDNQTGTVGEQLIDPFIIEVQDTAGHPVYNVSISWQIKTGGGQLSSYTTTTGTDGRAQVFLELGAHSGVDNNSVDAVRNGLSGSPLRFHASATPGPIDHYDIETPIIALVSTNFEAVPVQAKDLYGNLISTASNTIYFKAVDPTTSDPFPDGNLTPVSAELTAGEVSISDMQYDTARDIRIQVWDNEDEIDNNVSYSNVISVVTELGNCFGRTNTAGTLIIDSSETHYAEDYPGGIIDCSEVDVEIRQGIEDTVITLASYQNGDTEYPDGDIGITIMANSFELESGAKLDVAGKGYPGSKGPGAGIFGTGYYPAGGGGAHGGYGSWGVNGPSSSGSPAGGAPNGDVFEPTFLGSGGGKNGGAGGGAIKILISATHFTHANSDKLIISGEISADGLNGIEACPNDYTTCGGGAGGSIWLITNYFEGFGSVHANGGTGRNGSTAGKGGGGSGGRIAVEYQDQSNFSGLIFAHGGSRAGGGDTGGAGTIYFEQTGVQPDHGGDLYIDNNGNNHRHTGILESSCADQPSPAHGGCTFNSITLGVDLNSDSLQGYGHLDFLGTESALTITSTTMTGDGTSDLTAYGTMYVSENPLTISQGGLHVRGDITAYSGDAQDLDLIVGALGELRLYANTPWRSGTYTFNSITAENTGYLTLASHNDGDTDYTDDYGVTLNLTRLDINNGGTLTADGIGYGINQGPGNGNGNGAGHGGYGGNGSSVYDSVFEPIQLGSGGGAGAGGGMMKINVSDTLTLDGSIHADGISEGSGGSIWIDTNILAGGTFGTNGFFSANGGTSTGKEGGGGGRIAIYYNDKTGFNGAAFAHGGGYAGPGTVYWEQKGVHTPHGGLLNVDNNGVNHGYAGILESSCQEDAPPYGCLFEQITLGSDLNGDGIHGYGHVKLEGSNSKITLVSSGALLGDGTSKLDAYGLINFNFDPFTDPVIIENVDIGVYGDLSGITDLILRNNGKLTLNARTIRREERGITPINRYTFNDIKVENTGIMTALGYDDGDTTYSTTDDYGVELVIDNLDIQTGGIVRTDGSGYGRGGYFTSNRGPGGGGNCSSIYTCYSGAGTYGGYGQRTVQPVYGNVYQPSHLGSAGGSRRNGNYGSWYAHGGLGGGAIYLDIDDTLQIDGILSSNSSLYSTFYPGTNNWEAGSGGSIWIDARYLNGSGYIEANGGTSVSYGGGGRIALYYEENNGFPTVVDNTTGNDHIQAHGNGGGPGTIYVEQKAKNDQVQYDGTLYVNNGGVIGTQAGLIEDDYEFNNIILSGYGNLDIEGQDSSLTLAGTSIISGDGTSTLRPNGMVNLLDSITIEHVTVDIAGSMSPVTDMTIQNHGGVVLHAKTAKRTEEGVSPINRYDFDTLTIGDSGRLTLDSYDNLDSAYATDEDFGVQLYVEELAVAATGVIDADGRGYGKGGASGVSRGPGGGDTCVSLSSCYGGAGSYGGYGGRSSKPVYGNIYEPEMLGSSGGCWVVDRSTDRYHGGLGGGAIYINVNGVLDLNGIIRSNGELYSSFYPDSNDWEAGSGGSIWIDTKYLDGTGYLQANGGTNVSHGAGGRIAVYYEENNGFNLDVDENADGNHLQAYGNTGGPGTIYIEQKANGTTAQHNGALFVNNNSVDGRSAGIVSDTYELSDITLTEYGDLTIAGSDSSLSLTSGSVLTGDGTSKLIPEGTLILPEVTVLENITVDIAGTIEGGSTMTLDNNSNLHLHARTSKRYEDNVQPINQYSFSSLTIGSNSKLVLQGYDDGDSEYSADDDYGVSIAVSDNVTIGATGSIVASGLGYAGYRGPGGGVYGTGSWPAGGGAGHGGYGAEGSGRTDLGSTDGFPGNPYGDIYKPLELGSGGGRSGGGAIELYIEGTLDNNGGIHADGQGDSNSDRGGGSGGSIYIETSTLSGNGVFSSNGGSILGGAFGSNIGGGGGGGRIAVLYDTSTFTGTFETFGGIGARSKYGGPGTIYLEDRQNHEQGSGSLIIDNNDKSNASNSSDFPASDYRFHDLTIGRYVTIAALSDNTYDHSRGPHFLLNGNFLLEQDAVIDGKSKGFLPQSGPGTGSSGLGNSAGGGAGHGGAGGVGQNDTVNPDTPGGIVYDSAIYPVNIGSGGGNGGSGSLGGGGGAAIAISTQEGQITIEGNIDMSGGDGLSDGTSSGGGGSGGSIYIKGCDIYVNATAYIDASGGDSPASTFHGGGGGGGIVSLAHTCTDTLYLDPAATIDYSEGTGFQSGGEGVLNMYGVPSVTLLNQYRYRNKEQVIDVGETIDERRVRIKANVTDADTEDTLIMDVELKPAGDTVPFDGTTGIVSTDPTDWELGDPMEMEVIYTDATLDVGEDYKWRLRIRDEKGATTSWVDFGDNANLADFSIASEWAPEIPTNLAQYKADGTTLIPTGDITDETTVILKTTLGTAPLIGSLTPEFEVRTMGVDFLDSPTHTGELESWLAGDIIGTAHVTDLEDSTNYHWQVRSCNGIGVCSGWIRYGGNMENEADFGILLPEIPAPEEETEEETDDREDTTELQEAETQDSGDSDQDFDSEISTDLSELPDSGDTETEEETKIADTITHYINETFDTTDTPWLIMAGIFLAGLILNPIFIPFGLSLTDLPYLLQRLRVSTLYTLGLKSKGYPWGIVYDSVTKELLSRCVVRLRNSSGELTDTTVTDVSGVFNFEPRAGVYQLEVSRSGYYFPSTVVTGSMDGIRKNVYHGEPYRVAGDKEPVRVFVPMDHESSSGLKGILVKISSFIVGLFMVLSPFLLILGMILSYTYWVQTGNALNLLLLAGYILMFGLYLYGLILERGSWGYVVNTDMDPIPNVTVGLYDPVYDRLVDTRISDEKGRFRFVVPGGEYILRVEGTEYVLAEPGYEAGYVVGGDKEGNQQITERVVVRKTRRS